MTSAYPRRIEKKVLSREGSLAAGFVWSKSSSVLSCDIVTLLSCGMVNESLVGSSGE